MGWEELKWHQLEHHQLINSQGPHFSPHSTAKINDKSTLLRKNGLSGKSEVVIASVYSEKTRLKKLMIIMNKSQENDSFSGPLKLTFAIKIRPEKRW